MIGPIETLPCPTCDNEGVVEWHEDHWSYSRDCHYQTGGTMECPRCDGTCEILCAYCGDGGNANTVAIVELNGDPLCGYCYSLERGADEMEL